MRRLVGLAFIATLSLATRANALPDLVSSGVPPGWTLPALPRSSGDATTGSCVLQAPALPGESGNTWFNGSMQNIGSTTASGGITALFLDDVLRTLQGPFTLGVSAFGRYVNVPSSLVIKGGRHTLLSRADAFGGVTESFETNNDWAQAYIWSPLALTAGVPVTRTYDPPAITTLFNPYYNCEGFSGTTDSNWWYAFAVLGDDAGSDFDVRLHTEVPANSPQAGFGVNTAWSGSPGDHFDAVIVDKNITPSGTYYAGVVNFLGTGNKVVQFEESPPVTWVAPGVYGPFTMGSGDIVDLHEIYGFTSDLLRIEIRPLSGDANLGASLIGPVPGGQSDLNSHVVGGFADNAAAGASEVMQVNLSATSYHGLVVFKHDSSDLWKSCTYEIIISPYPNLVANYTPPGWSGPIVPENVDTMGEPFTLPPTLNGNQATTSFNDVTANLGTATTTTDYGDNLFVDDVLTWRYIRPSVSPVYANTYVYIYTRIGEWQSIVGGGRHHLRHDTDVYNNIDELAPYETDNTFTDWFVWTPLELADQVPVLRTAPPTRFPQGFGPYESSDGFRIPGNVGYYWTAVSMIPNSMGSDYDVRMHSASTGSKDGFGDWLVWSYDPFPGNPDFCIVNYNIAPSMPRDVSVTNWNVSGAGFYVERSDAPYYGVVPPGISYYGPMTLPANACLNIHEFFLTAGTPRYIWVVNLDGGADLELYLFDGAQPYHMKGTYTAFENSHGPGESEHFGPLMVPTDGYYAVVVAKSKATDVDLTSHYQIMFSDQDPLDAPSAGTPLPTRFALSSAHPNPASAGTSFELAVPEGQGGVTVAVYDLAGRRVRTLVRGEITPGRHQLTWDGRDASGNRAAPGVYLAKLEAPHVKDTKKIMLLQ